MNGALVTFRKELFSYCLSPVSWLIGFLFYFLRGFQLSQVTEVYAAYHADTDRFPAVTYGLSSTYIMVILVPGILTMRTFAEERRTGSLETLMTAPVRDGEIVLGKWAAATALFALLWLPSVLILHVLQYGLFLGTELPFGPVFAAYVGMFLLSGLLLSFGCFASSLTDNVLLSAVLTILFCYGLIELPGIVAASLGGMPGNYYVHELLDKVDVMTSFKDWFARGLIDTSQVAFYVGGIVFFLFLTTVSLASRRLA